MYRTSGPLNLVGSGRNDYVNVGLNGSVQGIHGLLRVTNPPTNPALLDALTHNLRTPLTAPSGVSARYGRPAATPSPCRTQKPMRQ